MKQDGWDKKAGVRIVQGRWQDVVGSLGTFDGIFFDTHSEFYDDLRYFYEGSACRCMPIELSKT